MNSPGGDGCDQAALELQNGALHLGLALTPEQIERFARYCTLLLEANQHVNLTAVRSPSRVMHTLFLDSLTVLWALERVEAGVASCTSLIDVGTGAGVPGLPLKLVRPDWNVTLVDSVRKKAAFLQSAVNALEITGVRVVAERAEELGHRPHFRDSYGVCTARAVAALPTLLEYCAPLVAPGGVVALPRSGGVNADVAASEPAARALALNHFDTVVIPDHLDLGPDRAIVMYRKSAPTPPGYPRRTGLARSRPIGSQPRQVR